MYSTSRSVIHKSQMRLAISFYVALKMVFVQVQNVASFSVIKIYIQDIYFAFRRSQFFLSGVIKTGRGLLSLNGNILHTSLK